MAKLYFRYGTVGSAKTLYLLAVAHNYVAQGKKILLLKPKIDDRFGETTVRTRAGLAREADYLVGDDTVFGSPELLGQSSDVIDIKVLSGVSCILADEAQFFTAAFVNQLHAITVNFQIPVICYGLRTDFRRGSFEGARRLFEIADTIEEIKTTCAYCNSKAIFNMKLLGGRATLEGPTIDLGAEEKYLPVCKGCYWEKIQAATTANVAPSAHGGATDDQDQEDLGELIDQKDDDLDDGI